MAAGRRSVPTVVIDGRLNCGRSRTAMAFCGATEDPTRRDEVAGQVIATALGTAIGIEVLTVEGVRPGRGRGG